MQFIITVASYSCGLLMCIISLILIVPETTKLMFDKYLEKGDECVDIVCHCSYSYST